MVKNNLVPFLSIRPVGQALILKPQVYQGRSMLRTPVRKEFPVPDGPEHTRPIREPRV